MTIWPLHLFPVDVFLCRILFYYISPPNTNILKAVVYRDVLEQSFMSHPMPPMCIGGSLGGRLVIGGSFTVGLGDVGVVEGANDVEIVGVDVTVSVAVSVSEGEATGASGSAGHSLHSGTKCSVSPLSMAAWPDPSWPLEYIPLSSAVPLTDTDVRILMTGRRPVSFTHRDQDIGDGSKVTENDPLWRSADLTTALAL